MGSDRMFGRKGLQPPAGPEDNFEAIVSAGGKIDRAMSAAIALLSATLAETGRDAGALALPGPIPTDVSGLIADCITYRGKDGPEYATLGVTPDFKAFSYQPHCYLFVIANTVGIAEQLPDERARFAGPQCAEPLFHAHVMRRWARHVLPVGKAMAAADREGLTRCIMAVRDDIVAVANAAPAWMHDILDLRQLAADWGGGYPATIGRPLDESVKRMNGIPMSDFVAKTLTDWLARLQADGLRGRSAA